LFCPKLNVKLRKLQQQQEKIKIIYLKDDKAEPHTLRMLLSCSYETLEICSRLILTVCTSS